MQLSSAFTKELPFSLTPVEVTERSRLLASVTKEIEDVETEKSQANRGFSERLKTLRQRQIDLANAVHSLEEKRPVLCDERADMRRFQIETVRRDNGEVVDFRAMKPEEIEDARQGGLFVDQAGVRVAAPKGTGLDLATPPAEIPADSPTGKWIEGANPRPVDMAELAPGDAATITNPEGLLNGDEAKKAGKGRKRKRGAIAPPTPTETLGVAAIVTDDADDPAYDADDDDLEELGDEEPEGDE